MKIPSMVSLSLLRPEIEEILDALDKDSLTRKMLVRLIELDIEHREGTK